MPRHLRKRFVGAKYHVMNRGNGRQRVFYGEDDYQRFMGQLVHALEMDEVLLFAYCLMPNHFHLFIETPRGNVQQFMGRLGTAYGMYFRYKHARPGHCFQGRYKAPLVEGDEYALRLTRYIHLNPIKVPSATGLSDLEKWEVLKRHRWSSLAGYMSARQTEELIDYRWRGLLGAHRSGQAAYRAYMGQMLGVDDEVLADAMKASSHAIGDEAFREQVAEWIRTEAAGLQARSDVSVPPARVVGIDVVAQAVAREFAVDVERFRIPRVRMDYARGIFVELACRLGRISQRDVAKYLGSVSEHAVGRARCRLRDALKSDAALTRRIAAIEKKLTAKV